MPVALGPPGAHDEIARPGGRAPVDGPHVVADHVAAQRVELAALPALADQHRAVDLPQPGQLLGQEPPGAERRQHLQRARHVELPLSGGEPERSVRPDRHPPGVPLAAPRGNERGDDAPPFAARHRHRLAARRRPGRRHPRVADQRAQRAPSAVGEGQDRLALLGEPDGAARVAAQPQRRDAGGEAEVDDDSGDEQAGVDQHRARPTRRPAARRRRRAPPTAR